LENPFLKVPVSSDDQILTIKFTIEFRWEKEFAGICAKIEGRPVSSIGSGNVNFRFAIAQRVLWQKSKPSP
jgi:hypothetical protein